MREIWVANDWVAVGEALKKSERFKGAQGIQNSLKQVVGMIGGASSTSASAPAPKKAKRKVDDVVKEEAAAASTPSKKSKGKATAAAEKATPVKAVSAPSNEVEIEMDDAEGLADTPQPKAAKVKKQKKVKKPKET